MSEWPTGWLLHARMRHACGVVLVTCQAGHAGGAGCKTAEIAAAGAQAAGMATVIVPPFNIGSPVCVKPLRWSYYANVPMLYGRLLQGKCRVEQGGLRTSLPGQPGSCSPCLHHWSMPAAVS
jgi:hypothetical protein